MSKVMKCTSCDAGNLVPAYLENLFLVHSCTHCGGSLIFLKDYLRWLESNPENLNADTKESCALADAEDQKKALLCPVTGKLMRKFRITAGSDHRLDLSGEVNAIWIDKGEWELLRSAGLGGKLNQIFTSSWQQKVRDANSREVLHSWYEREFGEHFEAIEAFRERIAGLDNRAEIIAYLVDEDPYQA